MKELLEAKKHELENEIELHLRAIDKAKGKLELIDELIDETTDEVEPVEEVEPVDEDSEPKIYIKGELVNN